MRFSVLLVSWNGRRDTRRCLASLREQGFQDFETILVDNGSSDGTVEMVRSEFPFVTLLALNENTGFAAANNIAARQAKAELLFVVNTDTELPSDLLETLDRRTRQYPEFDIFSCQMISLFCRDRVDCKGMIYRKTLRACMIDVGKPVDPFEKPNEIFGATGGAMLLRRNVYERIGLFDERFFVNNEDVDFALRAAGAGFRTLYLPDARVFHRRSPNEARLPDLMLYYIQRNFELAAYKNLSLSTWLRFGLGHLAYNAYQIAKWAPKGKGGIVLKAKLDALKMMPSLKREPVSEERLFLGGRNNF